MWVPVVIVKQGKYIGMVFFSVNFFVLLYNYLGHKRHKTRLGLWKFRMILCIAQNAYTQFYIHDHRSGKFESKCGLKSSEYKCIVVCSSERHSPFTNKADGNTRVKFRVTKKAPRQCSWNFIWQNSTIVTVIGFTFQAGKSWWLHRKTL